MGLRSKTVFTIGFACASGWSDVICFARYQSFAALMTGNTIKAGIAAATKSDNRFANVAYYLSILLCYILGGAVFQAVKARRPKCPGAILAPVCLGLVFLVEILGSIYGDDRWHVCLLAPTFAIQNSLTFGGNMQTNTTIITGNMQKLSLALYQLLAGKMTKEKLGAIATPSAAIVCTLLSAIAGAFVLMDVAKMNAAWLFVPSGILQAVLLAAHDLWLLAPRGQANTAAALLAPRGQANTAAASGGPAAVALSAREPGAAAGGEDSAAGKAIGGQAPAAAAGGDLEAPEHTTVLGSGMPCRAS